MAKYDPLRNFLLNLPENQMDVTLTFKQVEKIIASKLPPSAYKHRAWWSNEKKATRTIRGPRKMIVVASEDANDQTHKFPPDANNAYGHSIANYIRVISRFIRHVMYGEHLGPQWAILI